ncbi:hypothetical protein EBR77_00235, partial [bacterium]|nr:hypothetical protein [bacterium]
MTYTHMRRLLSLFTCITLGLTSGIQAKYISGLPGAAGTRCITVDGILDATKLVTLSGNNPTTSSVSRLMYDGFENIVVGRFTASSGVIDTSFSTDGYIPLNISNIAGGAALYADGAKFVPGAIVKAGLNYNVLGSVRVAGATGTDKSKMFLSQIVAESGSFTALNTGGSIDLTDSVFTGAYGAGINNNVQFTINAAVTDGSLIYVVGSILDDSSSTGTANKKKAFVGTITAATGAWVTQTSLADVTYSSPNWSQSTASSPKAIIVSDAGADVELLGLAIHGTDLYVCGYHGAASKGAIVMHFGINAGKLTLDTTTFPSTGVYNYGTTGTKAWDIKYSADAFGTGDYHHNGDLVVAISESVTSLNPLEQKVTVIALTDAGTLCTEFSTDGIQTYSFSGIPSAYPHDFSLNYPEFSFANTHLTLQLDSSNNIYLCGSLSAYGMPFVYKLDAAGVEQPFAPNFRYGIDVNDLTSAVLDPSPVLYPIMGYSWDTSLQGLFASVIDASNSKLYLLGCNANVQRSTSSSAFTLNNSFDTVQQVPLDNLNIFSDNNNYPILRTASNTAGLTVTNLYNSSGVTLSANTTAGLALIAGDGGVFDPNSLFINIPTQHISADDFADDEALFVVYGSVDINGITIPLIGPGTITVTNEYTNDFTTANTGITGTLRGAYAGGLVEITFTSETITDTASGNVTGEYANPIITNYYSSSGVTVFANQTGRTVAHQSEAIFSTDLSIVIPKQTVAAGSFSGNNATVEVFGSVTVSGQEVALSGDGTITVTNAAGSDFSLADFASTLTGRYSGGTVTITVSSNGTNLTNVSSPTTDITTSNVNITVNNNYDPVLGTFTISVSDADISVTGESAYTVSILNFDVVETVNAEDQNLFGTVVVDFGSGVQTIAVAGRLDVTVANDQVTAIVVGGGTIDAPTGSYVIGRFNNDKTIFIKINADSGGSTIVNTRAAASIVGTCTLAFDNDATAGTSAVVLIDSTTGDNAMVPTTRTLNITMDSIDLDSTTKTFTQKGQHKILVTGTLQFDLTNSNELNQTVTVSGYMPI